MIVLYGGPTPNARKVAIALEEMGLAWRLETIDILAGDQLTPEFLALNPNNKTPVIVDEDGPGGEGAFVLNESGAILLYLAEKTGQFIPSDLRGRAEVLQWLFWQMGGLGPMAGQNHHFVGYAPEQVPYAIRRYVNETARLYGVMNKRLADRAYLAGDAYSIADMAAYPWVVPHERQQQDLNDFPHLQRWFEAIGARPATIRAYAVGDIVKDLPEPSEEERQRILFGNPPGKA